ncbi:uncharacterized protein WCC33_010948 [Rhinophrynus dorsalis]
MSAASKTSKSSLVNSLAKRYDPKALQNQGPVTTQKAPQTNSVSKDSKTPVHLNSMDTKLDFLNQKIDNLLSTQSNVIEKLENISNDIDCIEKDIEEMKSDNPKLEQTKGPTEDSAQISEMKGLFVEMISNLSSINKYSEQQAKRLDGMEQILLGAQSLIHFVVEEVKMSNVFSFLHKKENPSKLINVDDKIRKKDNRNQKERGKVEGKKCIRVQESSKRKETCLNKKKYKVRLLHLLSMCH